MPAKRSLCRKRWTSASTMTDPNVPTERHWLCSEIRDPLVGNASFAGKRPWHHQTKLHCCRVFQQKPFSYLVRQPYLTVVLHTLLVGKGARWQRRSLREASSTEKKPSLSQNNTLGGCSQWKYGTNLVGIVIEDRKESFLRHIEG